MSQDSTSSAGARPAHTRGGGACPACAEESARDVSPARDVSEAPGATANLSVAVPAWQVRRTQLEMVDAALTRARELAEAQDREQGSGYPLARTWRVMIPQHAAVSFDAAGTAFVEAVLVLEPQ